ncbi:DUF3043 domain-containing protein [Corynebacterium sp. LK2510]
MGVKLPWQKSEAPASGSTKVDLGDTSAPESAHGGAARESGAERALPKGYTPPKGRPTPKRQEQEIKRGVIRDPDALTPAQRRQRDKELKKSMSKAEWKEHKRAQREEARRSNKEIQARIDAGDDRFVLDRDKGEVRRFVRDWVDARRFLNNYVMFAALVMLLIWFLGSFVPQLSAFMSLLSMVFIVAVFAEAVLIGKRANTAVRERFPDTTDTGFGLGMYAFSRASQPRKWRSPKPRVAVGDKV